VSDDLWKAAQVARNKRNERHLRDGSGRILRTAIKGGARRRRLLAGFLQCGECGGSIYALKGGGRDWGCSWHRDRGTCENDARFTEAHLEKGVLRAVKAALDEEVVRHALEVALEDLRARIKTAEPTRIEAELAKLDTKIERAVDLAIEMGDMDTAKKRLRALRDERERLVRELGASRIQIPSTDELLPRLREKLRDLEVTLKADVALGRLAIGGLLGDQRLRVYRDGRIEGALTLRPEMLHAPKRTLGRADSVVAGEGFAGELRSPRSRP
jgi:hypothetical protein